MTINVNKPSDKVSSASLMKDNSDISNDITDSELIKNGNNGTSNAIVNSGLNENDDVSDMQSNNDISSVDNDGVNDNVYETSSEGLLSHEDSSDNDSDNEEESSDNGGRPPPSKLPVAGSVGSKVPMVPGAGVRKASSSRPAGLSLGIRKAVQDKGELSQRRR